MVDRSEVFTQPDNEWMECFV